MASRELVTKLLTNMVENIPTHTPEQRETIGSADILSSCGLNVEYDWVVNGLIKYSYDGFNEIYFLMCISNNRLGSHVTIRGWHDGQYDSRWEYKAVDTLDYITFGENIDL